MFILEILTGDEGPKPEVFWRARKKRSRASQKVRLATSTMPAPLAPTPMPTTSLAPCAQSMSMVAPSPEVAPPGREDDVSMGSRPATPTPSPAAILPQGVRTGADFLKSFPQAPDQTEATLKLWLGEAARRKIPLGHLVTALRHAGCLVLLHKAWFLDFTRPFLPYIPTATRPSEDRPGWE